MTGDLEVVWHVLVVDDEPDLRKLVQLTLEFDAQLEVVAVASSAAEAVDAAQRTSPDLIVLDYKLGGGETGLSIADRLRQAIPGVRLILFSANSDVIDLRDSVVDAVVAKTEIARLPEIAHRLLEA
ncbi:MAG: two-component system, NarL family, nitrate/nitrite response regulator NarP [Actinomycetota bacterium]|jgi:CheY-like chemotaxis protein|nr:two-component system, NarL family, nitrate/nitrite response regulator NarP [Actinomycetota bacterium]